MSAFRKGSVIQRAVLIKNFFAIVCLILPLFMTSYAGLAKNHEMPFSVEDMGIVVVFLVSAIGGITTIITSPKVGLPVRRNSYRIQS